MRPSRKAPPKTADAVEYSSVPLPDPNRAVAPTGKIDLLAGDYQSTLRASTKGDSVSSDFRITVATSTLWGITGVGIIAVALLVLVGAVARFGRR